MPKLLSQCAPIPIEACTNLVVLTQHFETLCGETVRLWHFQGAIIAPLVYSLAWTQLFVRNIYMAQASFYMLPKKQLLIYSRGTTYLSF